MSTEQNKNMRHWDALGKTDPSATKKFTRSGGFKGTAVKPIWCDKRMTEVFGPVGIGWGTGKPEFTVQPAGAEILVFCTVELWYAEDGKQSASIWGVGGDKTFTNRGPDDEAFKKAHTDAIGNAMKLLGVAADIHMGLFDDSKYVESMEEEFAPKDERGQAKPKLITKKEADSLIRIANDKVKAESATPERVKETIESFGFANCSVVTADKFIDVKSALEGL